MVKIRNPLSYLVETYRIPIGLARDFLYHQGFINTQWKEDETGLYVDKDILDLMGRQYYDRESRKEMKQMAKESKKEKKFYEKSLGYLDTHIYQLPESDYKEVTRIKEKREKVKKILK